MLASFATAVPEVNLRDELFFTQLRADEFSRLDAGRHAYLDYTGSALYAERQVRAHASLLSRSVFGNPHSENPASRESTRVIEQARAQVLRFLDAPAEEYAVIFTANASAAIKLVAESFPFGRSASLVMAAAAWGTEHGLLLVDTAWTEAETEAVLAWGLQRFHQPWIGAVITHLFVIGGSPVPAIVLLALNAIVAYAKRDQIALLAETL